MGRSWWILSAGCSHSNTGSANPLQASGADGVAAVATLGRQLGYRGGVDLVDVRLELLVEFGIGLVGGEPFGQGPREARDQSVVAGQDRATFREAVAAGQ